MSDETDFEIAGRLQAERLRATRPPETTTIEENVRTARKELRHGLEGSFEPGKTYDDVEIEKQVHGKITPG
jgi:hypothetical protein